MASQNTGASNSVHSQNNQDSNITYKYSVGFSNISPSVNIQEVFQTIQMEHIYTNYIKPAVAEQKKYLSYSFLAHFSQEHDQEVFINSYLAFKIPKSDFSALKKENIKKENLIRENQIIVNNVGINELSQIWDHFSQYGRIQLLKIDYFCNDEKIFNKVSCVFQTHQSAVNAVAQLNGSTQWGQKVTAELSPIPLPLKEQKVLFVKGLDLSQSDSQIVKFIESVFSPERIGFKVAKIVPSMKFSIPNATVYFEQGADLNRIVELTNEKEFEGNQQKITVQKFLTKTERVKEQTEKEKNKPLNVLYLQGLKPTVTEEQIATEMRKVFNENIQIKISLKPATYSQIKQANDSQQTQGQTAIVQLETEQIAEKVFLEIRKNVNFQGLFYPLFLKQNSFIQQFVNRVLRTQFLNLRKEYFERKQNQIRRMEEQKRRKKNVHVVENIVKPDFIDQFNPIFNPIDFNQLNLASELNQSTRTGTGNFKDSQDELIIDLSIYERNLNDPAVQRFNIANFERQIDEIPQIQDPFTRQTIYYKLLKERLSSCYKEDIPKVAYEMLGLIISELKQHDSSYQSKDSKEESVLNDIFRLSDDDFVKYFNNDMDDNNEEEDL